MIFCEYDDALSWIIMGVLCYKKILDSRYLPLKSRKNIIGGLSCFSL